MEWEALLEAAAPWSHYENLIVRIALNLWNGSGGGPKGDHPLALSPYDPGAGFDRHNWHRIMEALALARGKRMVIFDPPETGR